MSELELEGTRTIDSLGTAELEAAALLGHEPARLALYWVPRPPDLFRAHRGLDGLGRVARVEGARIALTFLLEVQPGYAMAAERARVARLHQAAARGGIDRSRLRLPPMPGVASEWRDHYVPPAVWLQRVLEAARLHRDDPAAGRRALARVPRCCYGSPDVDAGRSLVRAARVRDEAESFGASWDCLRRVRDELASFRVTAEGTRWAEARLVAVLRRRLLPWLAGRA